MFTENPDETRRVKFLTGVLVNRSPLSGGTCSLDSPLTYCVEKRSTQRDRRTDRQTGKRTDRRRTRRKADGATTERERERGGTNGRESRRGMAGESVWTCGRGVRGTAMVLELRLKSKADSCYLFAALIDLGGKCELACGDVDGGGDVGSSW